MIPPLPIISRSLSTRLLDFLLFIGAPGHRRLSCAFGDKYEIDAVDGVRGVDGQDTIGGNAFIVPRRPRLAWRHADASRPSGERWAAASSPLAA